MAQSNPSSRSGDSTGGAIERCVRELLADIEQLGIGDEAREVNGADAVDLLNHYLPQLRAAVAEQRG